MVLRSTKYERVRAGGRTVLLELVGEDDRFLRGFEVNCKGERVRQEDKFDVRLHIIEKAAIRRRTPMRMNLTYAELEADPEPVGCRNAGGSFCCLNGHSPYACCGCCGFEPTLGSHKDG